MSNEFPKIMRSLIKSSIFSRYQSTASIIANNSLSNAELVLKNEIATAKRYEEIPRISRIKTILGFLPVG